jgi:predicted outer membrane protein
MIVLGIIGASLAASFAFADSLTGERFVTKASIANQFEIQSSRLALDKAQNQEVKSFAQQMVEDHTKTGENLNEILSSSGACLMIAADTAARTLAAPAEVPVGILTSLIAGPFFLWLLFRLQREGMT